MPEVLSVCLSGASSTVTFWRRQHGPQQRSTPQSHAEGWAHLKCCKSVAGPSVWFLMSSGNAEPLEAEVNRGDLGCLGIGLVDCKLEALEQT